MLARAINLLLCSVYLWVTVCGVSLHSHEGDDTVAHESDCAACVMHFHGTAEEPHAARVIFARLQHQRHFVYTSPSASLMVIHLPPSRGPPFCV